MRLDPRFFEYRGLLDGELFRLLRDEGERWCLGRLRLGDLVARERLGRRLTLAASARAACSRAAASSRAAVAFAAAAARWDSAS